MAVQVGLVGGDTTDATLYIRGVSITFSPDSIQTALSGIYFYLVYVASLWIMHVSDATLLLCLPVWNLLQGYGVYLEFYYAKPYATVFIFMFFGMVPARPCN